MKTSQIGVDLIKHFEGLHDGDLKTIGLQPKMCPAGIWTEGYGRAMRDENGSFIKDKKIAYANISIHTEEEAETALEHDLQVFERIVMSKLTRPVKQNQFDALVSHAYNTGGSSKTLFGLINTGVNDMLLRTWWTSHYIMGGGVQLKGLIARREAEAKLYFI